MQRLFVIGLLTVTTVLVAQPVTDHRRQLADAHRQAQAARQRSVELVDRAKTARDQAERARAAQAAIAAQVQAAEADMTAAEARLALLDQLRRAQEQRLARQQQPIVKLVAALQTMARRPAAAALVRPGAVGDIIHVRALLATMTPQIAARSQGLRAEVEQARRLRTAAATTVTQLKESQRQRGLAQQRLVRFEAQQRASSTRFAGVAALEAQRALAIGESARDLQDLVGQLDAEAGLRNRLASLPGPLPRPGRIGNALPLIDIAQNAQRLTYRLPVLGRITQGFGEPLPSGARSRGVTIAPRPGALVVAPASGRITFAGLYRGYGAIAIIDHGGGYASLVTGLASNFARIGDTIDAGGPLGRAGTAPITVELRREGIPLALAPFIG